LVDVKPSARSRLRAIVARVAFALLPFLVLGIGTPIVFGCAATLLRRVSRRAAMALWASTAFYFVAEVVFLSQSESPRGSVGDNLSLIAFLLLTVGASVEAIAFGPWVARRFGRSRADTVIERIAAEERGKLAGSPALRLAIRQRERRGLARRILADDPRLADTLHIGRPDLARDFDDGGLIDVNQVPASAFTAIPGFTAEMAQRVVAARERLDGLRSPADLVVHADVPGEIVGAAVDVLVFRSDEPAES
jgi:hypothetical protein